MDIFSIDFTQPELNFIRQALETVQIQGRDARFCANIQIKIEQELEEITNMIKSAEQDRLMNLQQVIQTEENKVRTKKS